MNDTTNPPRHRKTRGLNPLDLLVQQSKNDLSQHREGQNSALVLPLLTSTSLQVQSIPVEKIDPNPWQPRAKIDEGLLQDLAASIEATNGIIEPIVVRKVGDRYQLVAGERRWRATQIAGYAEINAVIRELSDGETALVSLIENIDREDLSDYEIAVALNNVRSQFSSTAMLARYLKKDRKELYRYFAFLDLPDWIRTRLDVNPHLLHRVSADSLKSFFAAVEDGHAKYRDATMRALDLLESGGLNQSMLVPQIKRFALNSERPLTAEIPFTARGRQIGKMVKGDKHVRVSLRTDSLSEAQMERLEAFIKSLINGASD